MSDERKEHEEQVFKWIEIAEEDLLLANHAFTLESNVPYRLIAYHSQQCAEKYLKAFLVSRLVDFPYTHNLEALVNLCEKEIKIKDRLKDIFILSQFAAAKRYPGEYRNATKEDAIEAVKLAELTKQVIGEILEKDGFHFYERDK